MSGDYANGDAVITVEQMNIAAAQLGDRLDYPIPIDTSCFHLRNTVFEIMFGITKEEYFATVCSLKPYIYIRRTTRSNNRPRYKILEIDTGQERSIFADEVYGKVEIEIDPESEIRRWVMLNCLDETHSPDKQKTSDFDSYTACGGGAEHQLTFMPSDYWGKWVVMVPNALRLGDVTYKVISQIPYMNEKLTKVFKSKMGAGLLLEAETEAITYKTGSLYNQYAPNGHDTKSVVKDGEKQIFYVPLNVLDYHAIPSVENLNSFAPANYALFGLNLDGFK
jgi:hypothetical protein